MHSLSVACVSRDTTGRLASILRLYREAADEIIVALDDSVLDEAAAALGDAADRVFAIPFRPPVERTLAWLHRACTGDWVFRVDDDEVPSTALLRELAALRGNRELTHAFVPRRWLWGGLDTYLDAPPWRPDYQLRLIRSDPAVTWFPGITHWPAAVTGEHRYLSAPIYHLDLLANPRESRERKAHSYERAEPGRRAAGLPFNLAYYLPELRPNARLASVPGDDAAAIDAALHPRVRTTSGPRVEPVDAAEIDELWNGADPSHDAYRAELTLVEQMSPFTVDEVRTVDVRVRNLSDRTWPPGGTGRHPVALSYRWDESGEGLRTTLPERIAPGAQTIVPVTVAARTTPGVRRLSIDLLEEHARWFDSTVEAEVEVVLRARLVVAGQNEDLQRLAAERLAELRPELEPILLALDAASVSRRLGYAAVQSAHEELLRPSASATLRRGAGILARAHSSRAPFVEAVRGADGLLVVGVPQGRRERFVETILRRVARRLRVPVVEARSADQVDGAIASLPLNVR